MPFCTRCNEYHTTSFKSCPECREWYKRRSQDRRKNGHQTGGRRAGTDKTLFFEDAAEYEAQFQPPLQDQTQKMFTDPWLDVCGECGLPDCIIGEGLVQLQVKTPKSKTNGHLMLDCPAAAAKYHGWTPDEALTVHRHKLKLLEPELA